MPGYKGVNYCMLFLGHTWKGHMESGHNSAFRGVGEKLRLIYVRVVDNVYWQKAFLVKNGKAIERRI